MMNNAALKEDMELSTDDQRDIEYAEDVLDMKINNDRANAFIDAFSSIDSNVLQAQTGLCVRAVELICADKDNNPLAFSLIEKVEIINSNKWDGIKENLQLGIKQLKDTDNLFDRLNKTEKTVLASENI